VQSGFLLELSATTRENDGRRLRNTSTTLVQF